MSHTEEEVAAEFARMAVLTRWDARKQLEASPESREAYRWYVMTGPAVRPLHELAQELDGTR
jgi:hypothetical protein